MFSVICYGNWKPTTDVCSHSCTVFIYHSVATYYSPHESNDYILFLYFVLSNRSNLPRFYWPNIVCICCFKALLKNRFRFVQAPHIQHIFFFIQPEVLLFFPFNCLAECLTMQNSIKHKNTIKNDFDIFLQFVGLHTSKNHLKIKKNPQEGTNNRIMFMLKQLKIEF